MLADWVGIREVCWEYPSTICTRRCRHGLLRTHCVHVPVIGDPFFQQTGERWAAGGIRERRVLISTTRVVFHWRAPCFEISDEIPMILSAVRSGTERAGSSCVWAA